MPTADLKKQFLAARRAGTPLMAINTPDPAAIEQFLLLAVTETPSNTDVPFVRWDCGRGFTPLNILGTEQIGRVQPDDPIKMPEDALGATVEFAPETIVFMHGMNRFLNTSAPETSAFVVQAVWNLRDQFKSDGRTLVLLAPQFILPAEIADDVLLLDEPLPNAEARRVIIEGQVEAAKLALEEVGRELPAPDTDALSRAVTATGGLPAFVIEQVTAMSLSPQGLDVDGLWQRKEEKVRAIPGLNVWKGKQRFADIGGYDAVKDFCYRVCTGPGKPGLIVWADEFEKMMAGVGTDSSGVKTALNGILLSWMQERAVGVLCVGAPGVGKSEISKTLGNETGLMTVEMNIAKMQGSLVGESEQNMSRALKVFDAISDGPIFVIATCNSLANLSPELRRRFLATFYFPLPSSSERKTIWDIYRAKYDLTGKDDAPFDDTDWTGAEIKKACDFAWRLQVPLSEAARYVVPVAVSDRDKIEQLAQTAHGKFLSASVPGVYCHTSTPAEPPKPKPSNGRKMQFSND